MQLNGWLAAAVVLVLVACSGDDRAPRETTDEDASATEEPTPGDEDGSAEVGDADVGDADADAGEALDATGQGDGGVAPSSDAGPEAGSQSGGDGGPVAPRALDAGPFCQASDAAPALADACAGGDFACQRALCGNGVRDGSESDIDCGGVCGSCALGARCASASDCASNVCAPRVDCSGPAPCSLGVCVALPPVSHVFDAGVGALLRDPRDGTLYASLGATQASAGSVVAFAPDSTEPRWSLPLPAAAGPLALTEDGTALYVGIRGDAPGVVRVDLSTKQAAAPFSLGRAGESGPLVYPLSLASVPGAPDTVVVVGGETGISGDVGVHLYRNGMPLFDAANTRWATNAGDYFGLGVTTAVATSPTRLYAFNGWDTGFQLAVIDVTSEGLRIAKAYRDLFGEFNRNLLLRGGKLFHDARAVGLDDPPRRLGTFAGTGAMAVSSDGRHAYRIHASYGLPYAIACFDAVSFEQTGLVALDLLSTDVLSPQGLTALELWGADGLAVVGSGTKLRLIPGALRGVPGCDPGVPAPAAPALPSAPDAQDGWTQTYYLSANQIVHDAARDLVYATVSDLDPRFPNRVIALRGDGGGAVFASPVGSQPDALAVATDGSRVWTALRGAPVLVSIDAPQGRVLPAIPLPRSADAERATYVSYLVALPGQADAVVGVSNASLNIYDQGVPRFPFIAPGQGSPWPASRVQLGADGRLYASGSSGLRALRIGASNFEVEWSLTEAAGSVTAAGGLLLSNESLVFRETDRTLAGTLPSTGLTLAPNGRHAYLARAASRSPTGATRFEIRCFDTSTYAQSGSLVLDVPDPRKRASAQDMVLGMLGDSGLYLKMANALALAPSVLNCVPGCAPDAAPPSDAVFAADGSSGADGALAFAPLDVGGLAHDPVRGTLFATVTHADTRHPNQVISFDATSGAVQALGAYGSNPGPLAVAGDGSRLYVGLTGAGSVAALQLPERTLPQVFSLGRSTGPGPTELLTPARLAVMPGAPTTVAVSRTWLGGTVNEDIVLYRAGVRHLGTTAIGGGHALAFAGAGTLWSADATLLRISIAENTLTTGLFAPSQLALVRDIVVAGGKLFADTGAIVDAQSGANLGRLPVTGALARNDAATHVLVATGTSGNYKVTCYDAASLSEVGSVSLRAPMNMGASYSAPTKLEPFGAQGLALRTDAKALLLFPRARATLPGC